MRDLVEVIDQILAIVPPEEEDFRSELDNMKSSAIVSAPELMQFRWARTADTLADYMGDELHTEGWKKQVQDIWMDRA